jgi:hypothetical protein
LVLLLVLIVGPKLFIEPGTKAISEAFERERPRIVNNFAASASPGYELSSFSEEMNKSRLSSLAMRLEWLTNTQITTSPRLDYVCL